MGGLWWYLNLVATGYCTSTRKLLYCRLHRFAPHQVSGSGGGHLEGAGALLPSNAPPPLLYAHASTGQQGFAFCEPLYNGRNSLPAAVHDCCLSLNAFKQKLKTYLFDVQWRTSPGAAVMFLWVWRHPYKCQDLLAYLVHLLTYLPLQLTVWIYRLISEIIQVMSKPWFHCLFVWPRPLPQQFLLDIYAVALVASTKLQYVKPG